jgi:hypothetical protein
VERGVTVTIVTKIPELARMATRKKAKGLFYGTPDEKTVSRQGEV